MCFATVNNAVAMVLAKVDETLQKAVSISL